MLAVLVAPAPVTLLADTVEVNTTGAGLLPEAVVLEPKALAGSCAHAMEIIIKRPTASNSRCARTCLMLVSEPALQVSKGEPTCTCVKRLNSALEVEIRVDTGRPG